MRFIVAGLLTTALAACGDTDPTTPLPPPAADQPTGGFAGAPLRDALDRIVPALGSSQAPLALGSALTAAWEVQIAASTPDIETALHALVAENPDAAVEADAIRLALVIQR